jgi:hypothetical protein
MTGKPASGSVNASAIDSLIEMLQSYSVVMLIDAGKLAWKLGSMRDRIHNLDGVGARLALDGQDDGALVDVPGGVRVFSTLSIGVATSSNVPGRRCAGHDQWRWLRPSELAVVLDGEACWRPSNWPSGWLIGLRDGLAQLVDARPRP